MRTHRKCLVLFAAPALVLAACSSGPDQPDTVAGQFADALTRDDIAAAADLTDDPAKATDTLGKLYDGLGKEVKFDVRAIDQNTFSLAATWKLGKDGKSEWTYTTTGAANDRGDGWKIAWNPDTVAPGLAAGPLSYSPVYPQPARVLDASGGDLMTQQVVTLVNVSPGADTGALAGLLGPISPGITAASLQSELAAAQGKPITAISLRDADIAPIQAQLAALPGVTLAPQTRLLTTDKALSSPVLSGLTQLWQQTADENAGWAVRAQTAQGTQRVGGRDAKPTTDIATTLNIDLQHAAEAALAPITQPAAIVALQPSTGNVVAVAQNDAADAQGPIALTGLYPPGSTFKTVTVSAALEAGTVTPDTVLPCPGVATIEGRRIPNDNNFDLGSVPLHTAFARSCNTTMGALAVKLPADALTAAAAQLGLGIDYVTPGLTTVTGKVPPADTPTLRVESAIGQGQVTATPFGMALVAASIAHGSAPAPAIVKGKPGTADKTPAPLPATVVEQVKTMMRETVTSGTATQLRDIPGLLGKTGTAEFIDDKHAHGWFVGIADDLAFAVFINDANSSGPAVDAAGRMLRAVR
ncbi:putative penicillin-binding protein [Nocardia brasiliensis NBRC 14402]|uniref:penicillin-binding transpeptidase domain-containing protein n=1 Tax=Nocardia brasiliensis TaxID=37326 RepID=UPI00030F6123|nr:penicillin-binding transpeptidase domain-containing protein [Nocardia brasiliensis]ASF08766.1 penicillin-binding protein [Nocardia brasiliensis]GAJ81541.1 putative penicillin-binding protein [Nocardia brasiliensis NBRC 14402]